MAESHLLMSVSHLLLLMFHDLMLICHLLILIPRLLISIIHLLVLTPCQLNPIAHLQTMQTKRCSQTKAAFPQQTMCFQSQEATPLESIQSFWLLS